MDPLSITAGVLAILGIAGAVTKGIVKVRRALHYAPTELWGLMNEVSDLQVIISQVATFGNQLEEERYKGPVVALKGHLSRAMYQLRTLDNLINVELLKVRADGATRMSRKAWIRLKSEVESTQKELRSSRVNIGTALGIVTLSTAARVELGVVEISSQLVAQQQATTALLSEIATRVRELDHTGLEPISGDNGLSQLSEHRGGQNMTHQNLPPNPGTTCLKRASPSMHVSYCFPTWFVSRVLNFTASFNAFKGPQLNLDVPRVVDWMHPLWRLARRNNVGSIRTLFSKGLASPFDVNAFGQSALHCTVVNRRIECSKFLIQQGADTYLKDENGRKPIDSAWDLALSNRINPEESGTFLHLFDGGDYLETRQFSIIHKIIVGITQVSLGSQLDASTTGIDTVDANDRTGLSLAAVRGDNTAVKILLDHGANPEIRDFEGNTALNQAVRSAHLPTVQLLLDYGVDTNKRNAYGRTVLHQACHAKDDPALVRPLITVDVNATDFNGDTALQYATQQNHINNVLYLLESNADPEIANAEGDTPILTAIDYQMDRILQALLNHKVNHRIRNSRRQTILHAIASEGTAEGMKALANARLNDLDVLAKESENMTCLDYFEARENSDSAVQSAFEDMIGSVKRQTGAALQRDILDFESDSEDSQFMDAVEWQTGDGDHHEADQ
ncbi:MAG: hypothetical protein Q9171_006896 [Xanthocarpia ochracea]